MRIDSDGWTSYRPTIANAFGRRATHSICIKAYGRSEAEVDRYERARVISVKREGGWNPPMNIEANGTSFAERLNLQIRTGIKRFARLTISYSKSLENHRHAVSLYVAYFNYVRRHSTSKRRRPWRLVWSPSRGPCGGCWTNRQKFFEVSIPTFQKNAFG